LIAESIRPNLAHNAANVRIWNLMKHKTGIETTHPPGYIGEPLNLLVGCEGHSCQDYCWAWQRVVPRMAANPKITCLKCKTYQPHTHFERALKIPKNGQPRCYFQDMAEPSDFSDKDIATLQRIIRENPRHIFQILTHFPASFYARFPVWPDNTWAMGSFTSGQIYFPRNMQAGVVAAYCEPIRGHIWFDWNHRSRKPDWLVIGAQTGKHAVEPDFIFITTLLADCSCLDIPIFMKPHPIWKKLGLDWWINEWPKGYER